MADERKDREYGNRLIQEYMGRWYKTPKDFASYLYVSQVLQADGVRVAMEAHRRAMPYCMGSLYWQIDDCWPVASWSSIDYYGRWKALHYTARAAYAPVIISPVISGDTVTFYVVSDRLDTFVAALEVNVRDFRGDQVSSRSIPITVEANAAAIRATLKTFDLVGDHHAGQLVIVSRITDKGNVITENISYFRHPKDLLLERPDIESRIAKTSTGYSVELTSGILAKSVFLSCEDDSAFFSDNYFDVVAHAKKTIECRTTLGPDAFRTSLKITSLTDSY
jgi:beta-mannosidase